MHKGQLLRKGFSLVELLLVVAIIGILATITAVSFGRNRQNAYNANVRNGAQAYSQAMELYYAQNGNYFVYNATKGCALGTPATSGYKLRGNGGTGCVGLGGGSEGRITRRSVTGVQGSYPATSIADELVNQGYMKEIRAFPDVSSFTTNSPDYVLTLCDADGKQASTIKGAVAFGVVGTLKGTLSQADKDATEGLCGGSQSADPWDITDWD